MSLPVSPDTLRLAVFIGLFVLLALAETVWPRRKLTAVKAKRWQANIGIIVVDSLVVRLLFPVVPVSLAATAQLHNWGLFNLVGIKGWPELLLGLVLLDLIIYLQHRLFHRIPLLWRLHRMHHTDLDLDVSSGTRFHPLEIALSLLIKMAVVLLFGIAPLTVLLFEILLNAASMFNHANLSIPLSIDRWLRLLVITPDMHRVHHSVIPRETDSNFGFSQPWWDRLLGTYRDQPKEGHTGMTIGLHEYRNQKELGFWRLLRIPFETTPVRRAL
ncbi:MAG: sterol desaturase family protein [Trichlorobacter sp.]|uniref:sterol desaturase family protein n=1 Tax=Trichlorobacter sp. TaxID=2911007 RepID=UPI0025622F02|nr:sterol desaturase family protein [Trichlorobacter sp.]MDK9718310.1 sterol desaturase family protein [Trichlorobacter sp.]